MEAPLPRNALADLPPGADSPLNAAVAARDRDTLDMVSQAIRHKQVRLAYQPVMQAQPPQNTAFYEGLIRVLDATGRVIPAREFMGVIEATELGRELDCLALEQGLRALMATPSLRLSINMSARSIGFKRWSRILDRFLKRDAQLGERLILEISEASAMTVPELVMDFMDHLQPHGIAFALDDFGAGAMELRLFRDFLFDAVKIDGQFVRGLHDHAGNQALVRALLSVAREFEMFTVAESVETAADARLLAALGVDCLQGYFFAAPTIRPPWLPEARGVA
ncbi:MAG TPA: EAL domain-containing protein [Rhodobacteraceae bacterium]|jgi:EAL domain-containing protein (putative c-di-GMP-specific phosphodiesterase class I)|nr:EAL domain-containing protein [Paracoccaceae bacterium]